MKKIFLFSLLMLLQGSLLWARGRSAEWYTQGNKYYQQKQYDSAAVNYERVAATQPQDAVVYYNLGNTYYRLNKIGSAVLNYARALKHEPGNAAAHDNLLLTQRRMTMQIKSAEDIFFVKWWNKVTAPNNATIWAIFTFILFVLSVTLLSMRTVGGDKLKQRVLPQFPVLVAFVFVCFLVPSYVSAKRAQGGSDAVVMVNDTPLNASPQKGKPLSLLPEGTIVNIKKINGDMAEVVVPDGRSGWVQLSWITKI